MIDQNLNHKIVTSAVIGICLLIAAYAVTQIFGAATNVLSTTAVFMGLILCMICLVSPKYGFYTLIFLCGYLDFIKRLLIFFGAFSFMDITKILAIGPAMTAALFISFFTRGALHLIKFTKLDIVASVIAIIALCGGFIVYSKQFGLGLMALSNTANIIGFAFLFPIITNTFSDQKELGKLFRFIRIVYIPVAIYGIWQGIFGLSDFEVSYLRSGMTILVGQLDAEHVRAFSTLNSSTAMTTIMSLLAVISLLPLFLRSSGKKADVMQLIFSGFLFLLYVIAGFMSLSRSGYAIWVGALLAYWFFKKKSRTIVLYVIAIGCFLGLIASAPYILNHLAEWDPSQYMSSNYGQDVTDIQTYSDRLKGFENLTRSTAMYSLFGLSKEDYEVSKSDPNSLVYNHDSISSFLVGYGVVPLIFAAWWLVWVLIRIHQSLLSIPPGTRRNFATLCLALMFGEMIPNVTSGAYLGVFPNNVFFWFLLGAACSLLFKIENNESKNINSSLKFTPKNYA